MNQKITAHPATAMELAWNRAVQKLATSRPPRKTIDGPRMAAKMVSESLGDDWYKPVTGAKLFELATAKGWDITREMANKSAKWHADYLKKMRDEERRA